MRLGGLLLLDLRYQSQPTSFQLYVEFTRWRAHVMLRLEAANRKRYYSLKFKVLPSQWNDRTRTVRAGHPQSEELNLTIRRRVSKANDYLTACLVQDTQVDVEGLKQALSRGSSKSDFWQYADEWLNEKRRRDQIHYWKRSRTILTKFGVSAGNPLPWDRFTLRTLRDFDLYMMEKRDNNSNTRGIAFKVLRTILNEAEHDGVVSPSDNPFVRFRMPEGAPVARAKLSLDEIRRMAQLELTRGSIEDIARDMYLVSFWTRGPRFGDLVVLKWSEIKDDRVNIVMGKTGQPLSVPVTADMQNILTKYGPRDADFLFPLLRNKRLQNREQMASVLSTV